MAPPAVMMSNTSHSGTHPLRSCQAFAEAATPDPCLSIGGLRGQIEPYERADCPSVPDDDDLAQDLAQVTPGYRRVRWAVALLNGGYGLAETVGGFLADSQALQAGALDFLGDGLITLLALLAIGWRPQSRARVALIEGLFLGALGMGVISTTAYRLLVLEQPEAELMGILGGIALAVNATAAMILIPHRSGDVNVRAVWLFSRNDALGNLGVVIAAGLVVWTGTQWPDLVAAAVFAVIFLHSSWSIVRDALDELRKVHAAASG